MQKLERSFTTGIVSIIVFHAFVSFSTLVLLERIGPKTETLVLNHSSVMAGIEGLYAGLLLCQKQGPEACTRSLTTALEPLTIQVSWPQGRELIASLQDVVARPKPERLNEVQSLLASLAASNREAMQAKEKEIRSLVLTGAWIVELLALCSILFYLFIANVTRKRSLEPLIELCEGLLAWQRGNRLRRMHTSQGSPDVREAMKILNEILDQHKGNSG